MNGWYPPQPGQQGQAGQQPHTHQVYSMQEGPVQQPMMPQGQPVQQWQPPAQGQGNPAQVTGAQPVAPVVPGAPGVPGVAGVAPPQMPMSPLGIRDRRYWFPTITARRPFPTWPI